MKKAKVAELNTAIVHLGNSKRLQAMRQKALGQHIKPQEKLKTDAQDDLQTARKLIHQRLAEITRHYPAAKQNSYFKIRYGITLDTLKKLSLAEIFKKLEINASLPEKISKLDYNGRSFHSGSEQTES